MLIKAGVDISRIERNTRRALAIIARVMEIDGEELIITSTYEGNHGEGSLHYANQAFDMRLPEHNPVGRVSDMKKALGGNFDVCPEDTHIHIEYDPK